MGVAADRVSAEMYVTRRNRRLYRRGCAVVGCVSRISGHRARPGPGGELVGGSDQGGIADSGEEFGAEPQSHSGHANNHLGEWMATKSDVGVGGLDAFMRAITPAPIPRPARRRPPRRQPQRPTRSWMRSAARNRPVSRSAATHRFGEWLSDVSSVGAAPSSARRPLRSSRRSSAAALAKAELPYDQHCSGGARAPQSALRSPTPIA